MITAKLLREWGACWNDARIVEAFGSRAEVSPREIAVDASVSLDDRLWVLCRTIWYLDPHAARLFAIESASLVAHLAGDEDDQVQYRGLLNDLQQIEDLPEDQRSAARNAAESAAWNAAESAAWNAARTAAWSAAESAAWSAAESTTWNAALNAARNAAESAARNAAESAAWNAAESAAWNAARTAAWSAAESAALQAAIDRAILWLGDYADGWEE